MATVTGYTAARMKAIEDSAVVDGSVVSSDLILTRYDGSTINAGNVVGPQGPSGTTGGIADAPIDTNPYMRKNGAWTRSEVSLAPVDTKKYVLKDGLWVLADRPWKIEVTNGAPSPPSGFIVGDIWTGYDWSVKFTGSGYTVNYTFEFRFDDTATSAVARFTLPASLRPIVQHTSVCYMADDRAGYLANGVTAAIIDTAGLVTAPRVQSGIMLQASINGTTVSNILKYTSIRTSFRFSGSYTRSSEALPSTATYV